MARDHGKGGGGLPLVLMTAVVLQTVFVPSAFAGNVTVDRAEPQQLLFSWLDERGVTFSADGRTMVFVVRAPNGHLQVLCESRRVNGRWSEPQVLPFSGAGLETDPFLTPDGRTLYFASLRPGASAHNATLGLWRAHRTSAGWGTPEPVPGFEDSKFSDRSPALGKSGRLYFVSSREGGSKLFYAEAANGVFGKPVSLGDGVNLDTAFQAQLAVSPDEKTLVFTAIFRPEEKLAPGLQYPRGDLFVSRLEGGVWGRARRLPQDINSLAQESSPSFSPDGRYLYFVSERGFATKQDILLDYDTLTRGLESVLSGRGNVYRVQAEALETNQ